jgi:hypothetical protein
MGKLLREAPSVPWFKENSLSFSEVSRPQRYLGANVP